MNSKNNILLCAYLLCLLVKGGSKISGIIPPVIEATIIIRKTKGCILIKIFNKLTIFTGIDLFKIILINNVPNRANTIEPMM